MVVQFKPLLWGVAVFNSFSFWCLWCNDSHRNNLIFFTWEIRVNSQHLTFFWSWGFGTIHCRYVVDWLLNVVLWQILLWFLKSIHGTIPSKSMLIWYVTKTYNGSLFWPYISKRVFRKELFFLYVNRLFFLYFWFG